MQTTAQTQGCTMTDATRTAPRHAELSAVEVFLEQLQIEVRWLQKWDSWHQIGRFSHLQHGFHPPHLISQV